MLGTTFIMYNGLAITCSPARAHHMSPLHQIWSLNHKAIVTSEYCYNNNSGRCGQVSNLNSHGSHWNIMSSQWEFTIAHGCIYNFKRFMICDSQVGEDFEVAVQVDPDMRRSQASSDTNSISIVGKQSRVFFISCRTLQ